MTSEIDNQDYGKYERRRKQVNVTMSKRELTRLLRLAKDVGSTPSTLAKTWLLERMKAEESAREWQDESDV